MTIGVTAFAESCGLSRDFSCISKGTAPGLHEGLSKVTSLPVTRYSEEVCYEKSKGVTTFFRVTQILKAEGSPVPGAWVP